MTLQARYNIKSRGVALEDIVASQAVARTEYQARLATWEHYSGLSRQAKAAFTKANGKPTKPTPP
jgi:hypothetical protein